ncbi:TetR/AcrR family transcriptional regulator [Alteromonas oceanisediminis]|uniref:TetR/AcrR family transcriptional regulator n=1 Tax=Alteromonas oceanisediminis TaxID=2836180 RepID=UPI001BDAFC37|nr:TetR/AcrR family transcriptional regulator [Alteromonas oceanisediminis]MBT0586300.1 TetR/AcrR family transcriptional regulator [Alteromonas oceanisediminis]
MLRPNERDKVLTRAELKLQTRAAIMKSAEKHFFSVGYQGTSLADVASDSGIKVPLIVYHFKNKEELWKECVNNVFEKLDKALAKMFNQINELSGADYIRALLKGYIQSTAEAPEYMRLLFIEGTLPSDRLTWLVDTHQRRQSDMIMDIIRQAQAAGIFKRVDVIHAKYILASAVGAPFVLAPEFALMTGKSAMQQEVIDTHVETCMTLLFDLPTD